MPYPVALAGERKRKAHAYGVTSHKKISHGYGTTKSRRFLPGIDRTGGYYGRYPMRDGELKFFDVTLDDVTIASGGNITPSLNLIPQGITESTRGGRKCTIRSINWRWTHSLPETVDTSSNGSGDSVRIILYVDKQCNGAAAVALDILETNNINSFRNLSNKNRFRILFDRTQAINIIAFSQNGTSKYSTTNNIKVGAIYKTCNIPIEFSNTTGAITEIRSNNIGVLLVGNAGTSQWTSTIRLRFSDAGAM